MAKFKDQDEEWVIEYILTHHGSGEDSIFEALWKSRDKTWIPYDAVKHLATFYKYLEVMGVRSISKLE